MSRKPRCILSGQAYEGCLRTRRGLPFVTTQYMKAIIGSILARVQRDQKVIICHFLWMANHAHMIIIIKDAAQCKKFYGEVQKQVTDAMKRLLGKKHLSLWKKNGTSVVRLGDAAAVRRQIAYLYANPAAANLEDTIERYPGLSSWHAFKQADNTVNAKVTQWQSYIRAPMIPKLPALALNEAQDERFLARMDVTGKKSQPLHLYPNAWMKVFGLGDEDVAGENEALLQELEGNEEEARLLRIEKSQRVKGRKGLRREAINMTYEPPDDVRKIFVFASCKKLRIRMIAEYKEFCKACALCYEMYKAGHFNVQWPPGAFMPALPPRLNWWCAAGCG